MRARQDDLRAGGDVMEAGNGDPKPLERDGVSMMDIGAMDGDIYSGEKSKFEGYHTSLAVNDDAEEEDQTPLLGGGNKRSSFTAPKNLIQEARTAGEEDDVDPFAAHRRAKIADREDEYKAKRRQMVLSPSR